MRIGELKRKIIYRKILLNTLLLILKPTNKIIVHLSQDLDCFVTKYQYNMYIKYKKKSRMPMLTRKIA